MWLKLQVPHKVQPLSGFCTSQKINWENKEDFSMKQDSLMTAWTSWMPGLYSDLSKQASFHMKFYKICECLLGNCTNFTKFTWGRMCLQAMTFPQVFCAGFGTESSTRVKPYFRIISIQSQTLFWNLKRDILLGKFEAIGKNISQSSLTKKLTIVETMSSHKKLGVQSMARQVVV